MADIHGLRPASPKDAGAVSALASAAYAHYVAIINTVPAPMSADYSRFIEDEIVLVIDDDAGLAGSLTLMERPDHLCIWSIAVAPQAQGSGLGRQLMAWCEEFAKGRNIPEIRLFTHALMSKNREWYKRLGYIEVGEEWVGDKHRVNLVKRLNNDLMN